MRKYLTCLQCMLIVGLIAQGCDKENMGSDDAGSVLQDINMDNQNNSGTEKESVEGEKPDGTSNGSDSKSEEDSADSEVNQNSSQNDSQGNDSRVDSNNVEQDDTDSGASTTGEKGKGESKDVTEEGEGQSKGYDTSGQADTDSVKNEPSQTDSEASLDILTVSEDTGTDADAPAPTDFQTDDLGDGCPFECVGAGWCNSHDGVIQEAYVCEEAEKVCCDTPVQKSGDESTDESTDEMPDGGMHKGQEKSTDTDGQKGHD